MNLKTITKIFILTVVFIASGVSNVFAETLYFGSQARFSPNVDYKFLKIYQPVVLIQHQYI